MSYGFLDTLSTPSVKAAQAANGVAQMWERFAGDRSFDRFTPREAEFIAERDSFYMATVSESGWPYVQHRGGPPGFIKVLDERTLAFPDFRGNRQYISVGNLAADDRAALILVDYPNQARLKLLGHVETVGLDEDPELAARLALEGYKARPERAIRLTLHAFDWNCPQHITPRFTQGQIAEALVPTMSRLKALEAENADLRKRLAEISGGG
ncbi:pyridoxamine 5'-phosphate oxidase family protein [Caulobacter sp. KR2-114]|uniref:pyridoxamine 5'-phosphate oxidase family protein n=1 Tax=Caulobacter sp. KR2-114 TaxID=3400912 RepID=UPI003C04F57C